MTTAQKNLDATVLRAPAAGTIATVSAKVGDSMPAGSSSNASSSGSSGGNNTSAGSGGSSNSSSSSSGFITLTNLNAFQVKAGFSETDAGKIKTGMPATVTVDAIGGAEFNATVASMDVLSTTVSNVVTYYALLDISSDSTGLRPGMTATASVNIDRRDNVLHLANAALSGAKGTSVRVSVLENGQTVQKQVTTGLKGDDSTEITSGIKAGEQVIVASGSGSANRSGASNRSRTGGAAGAPVGGFGGGAAGGGRSGGGGSPGNF